MPQAQATLVLFPFAKETCVLQFTWLVLERIDFTTGNMCHNSRGLKQMEVLDWCVGTHLPANPVCLTKRTPMLGMKPKKATLKRP